MLATMWCFSIDAGCVWVLDPVPLLQLGWTCLADIAHNSGLCCALLLLSCRWLRRRAPSGLRL